MPFNLGTRSSTLREKFLTHLHLLLGEGVNFKNKTRVLPVCVLYVERVLVVCCSSSAGSTPSFIGLMQYMESSWRF